MSLLAIQYLEPSPDIPTLSPQDVRARLRDAFGRLPLNRVLVGWDLPETLLDVCADECRRAGADLYRWQPLLTGDGTLQPRPEWGVIGLDGQRVPGFRGISAFTFMCPNRPAVQNAILAHLHDALGDDRYQGVFLDRIRYPSPAEDMPGALGCFCKDCQRLAADFHLDLQEVRQGLKRLIRAPEGAEGFVAGLLDVSAVEGDSRSSELATLASFLRFRCAAVTRFVRAAAAIARRSGKTVGLDCFSPALADMVGQQLSTLDGCGDWIKTMSYGHTLGLAGLPFELLGLADWLVEGQHMAEAEAMALLSRASRLPLPDSRSVLRTRGLSPAALQRETARGHADGVSTLLAGIELVEMGGIVHLEQQQLAADLAALRAGGADGLVLSWDLWHIPPERLTLVREIWG